MAKLNRLIRNQIYTGTFEKFHLFRTTEELELKFRIGEFFYFITYKYNFDTLVDIVKSLEDKLNKPYSDWNSLTGKEFRLARVFNIETGKDELRLI